MQPRSHETLAEFIERTICGIDHEKGRRNRVMFENFMRLYGGSLFVDPSYVINGADPKSAVRHLVTASRRSRG